MIPNIHRLLLLILFVFFVASCSSGGDGAIEDNNTGDTTSDPTITPFSDLNADIYTGDTYDESEVSVDANGDEIIRTKLAILFSPSATKAEVDTLLSRINATVTAAIAGANSVSIRIPDPGTVENLETIIAEIESKPFVEAVIKSVIDEETAVPDNIAPDTSDDEYINNHAAVRGTAAWNAKEAISHEPNIILMDFFGSGSSPLGNYLDTTLSGNVAIGHPSPSDHGYHVAGIITGSFGGEVSTPGLVTGMFPGRSKLSIIDRKNGISGHDAKVLALQRTSALGGTVVMNTSLGKRCQFSTNSNTCREKSVAMAQGIAWADMVRAAGLESRLFHTKSAGNRRNPAPDMRDTQTNHAFATAATMTDMRTSDGTLVPPLSNTMVVERLIGSKKPREVNCLHDNSFVGGNISAIGSDVISLDGSGTARYMSGTSMAAPQVAGLAAYLLSIDNSLSPQRIKEILLDTAQPVANGTAADCSDWSSPAPAIDAYAAVLALDKDNAFSGSRSDAPVRMAILDVSNNGTNEGSNDRFDQFDLQYFIQELDTGSDEKQNGTEKVKYSRADLNGDGYDGGGDGYKKKFNLDIDYPPSFTTISQIIEDEVVEFDESSLSDDDILCYYAYSSFYIGSESERTRLLGSRCKPSKLAVYYSHMNEFNFPGLNSSCGNIDKDLSDERETLTTRPDATETNNIPERPDSHFWQPGDSVVDQNQFDASNFRSRFYTNGDIGNCDLQQDYYASSALNSSLSLTETDNILHIDIDATAGSECWDWDPETPKWECADSIAGTSWVAEYDFKIAAATKLNLNLNFICTGTNMAMPSFPGVPPATPTDVTYIIIRLNSTGELIMMNRNPEKIVVGQFYACNDDSPTINVEQLIEFDAPENQGDVDRVIIILTGGAGAWGNLGNALYLTGISTTEPTLGRQINNTTMVGTIQLEPAN